ncbi:hypothetical protein MP228_005002, partial [Amoeboaphelidium protococcarum]
MSNAAPTDFCSICDKPVAQMSKHFAQYHKPSADVMFKGLRIIVDRAADGNFHCPYPQCTSSLKDTYKFKRHVSECTSDNHPAPAPAPGSAPGSGSGSASANGAASASADGAATGAADVVADGAADVVADGAADGVATGSVHAPNAAISLALNSNLHNLSGVYFNASLGSFICLHHGYAVKRASVVNHMRTYHGVTVTLEDLMGFFQVNDSDFTDTFGFGPNDQPVAPYLGLQIMNKVYCSECGLIVCGDSARKDHQQHQTSQVHVQSVYTTPQNVSYFRVTVDDPEAAAADSDCAISRFIADLLPGPGSGLAGPLPATSADEPEMVSFESKMSLAHFTAKNAEYLKAIDVTIQTLESARNAHLTLLIAYMQTTMADIPAMNYRLRQRVMPADSVVGLKQLADASTLKRYSDQFLSFLHFVLADSSATAGDQQMVINENTINDVVQKVVLQKLDLVTSSRDESLVYRYLGYLYHSGCRRVEQIRHSVAFLLYCLRMVSASMIYNGVALDSDSFLDMFSCNSGNINELLVAQKILVQLASQCLKVAHIYLHPSEPDTYVVSGEKFSIPAFRTAITTALDSCKQLCVQLCLPRLSAADMIIDNVQNQSPGYGIGSQYLAEHPEAIQTALHQFIEKHSLLHLDKRAVLRVYRRFSTPLLELLLWLLHVLSGQPGRASEMVEYTLVNLPTLPRTMMKVMCTIACVPWYNKTDS